MAIASALSQFLRARTSALGFIVPVDKPVLLLNDCEKQHQSSSALRWGTFDNYNDITLNMILKSSVTNQDYIIPRGFSSR